jgi:heat shock protein HslJ
MKRIILFAIALFLLAACSSSPKVDLSGAWKLISYGAKTNPTPALPDVDTTITFENGQISGNVGCNTFGGEYKMKGDKITFGPVMSTEMFCETTWAQEQGVLGIITNNGAVTIQLTGDTLTITSADGLSVLILGRK